MDPGKAERHLQFVSNCTGGSLIELLGLLFIPCPSFFIKYKLEQIVFQITSETVSLILDLVVVILAVVLPCTLLSDYILEVNIVVSSTALLLYLKTSSSLISPPFTFPRNIVTLRRLGRTFVLVYTCVCIYAVDFPIFPRRFAKTEISGVSLMDTGVGLVAMIIGASNIDFIDTCRSRSLSFLLKIIAKTTIPCLLIGVLRTVVVKALGYPDHITEYGIHWNFFFTLAFIRLGGFAVSYLFRGMSDLSAALAHMITGLFLACFQQFISSPLTESLIQSRPLASTNKSDIVYLIRANAEGLGSLLGYLALFIIGTGMTLFSRLHLDLPASRQAVDKLKFLSVQGKESWHGDRKRVALANSIFGILALLVVAFHGEDSVSRRLVNLPYIVLQVGILAPLASILLYSIYGSDLVEQNRAKRKDPLSLATLIADNGLAYFLISNLITGVLNFLIDTLELAKWQPRWFAVTCQFLLLSTYTIACPLLAKSLSAILPGRGKAKAQMLKNKK